MPTITLADDELTAVTAAVRRTIETDRFPRAPRLDPLKAALGKMEAVTKSGKFPNLKPKVAPPAKPAKRARR